MSASSHGKGACSQRNVHCKAAADSLSGTIAVSCLEGLPGLSGPASFMRAEKSMVSGQTHHQCTNGAFSRSGIRGVNSWGGGVFQIAFRGQSAINAFSSTIAASCDLTHRVSQVRCSLFSVSLSTHYHCCGRKWLFRMCFTPTSR